MTVAIEPGAPGDGGLRLSVHDDGVGFDPLEVRRHTGMKSLATRLADLGATGGFVASASGGTNFEAVIRRRQADPLPQNEAEPRLPHPLVVQAP